MLQSLVPLPHIFSLQSNVFAQEDSIQENSTFDSQPLWQTLDQETDITTVPVELQKEYRFRSSQLSLVFTKLPQFPGFLSIRQFILTPQQVEELGTFNNIAYDIISSMENGTFSYDLTLPLPPGAEGKKVEVISADSVEELATDEDSSTQPDEVTDQTITIRHLDHFTVFVLVNDIDTDNPDSLGDSDDVSNGVLSAIQDSWIEQDNPSTTHGTSNDLNVQSKTTNKNQRALIRFDTSSIAGGSKVSNATVRLYLNNDPSNSRTYGIYSITSAWDEATVTWNNQPSAEGSSTYTTNTGTSNNVWIEWDVTGDVQSMIDGAITNFGWMIKDSTEEQSPTQQSQFNSSNHSTETKRPELVIDFSKTNSPDSNEYNYPSSHESGSTGDADGFESNPQNAFADGGGFASNINGAGDSHIFYDYGFALPTGSTVNGIEVRSDWYIDSDGGTNSLDIELSWDGGTSWTSTGKKDITETDKEHIVSLGGSTDTWGRTWTADELSNTNFRVRTTMSSTAVSSRDFYLDWIPVRVYYTSDTTAPTSTFSAPSSATYWNIPITITGSSTDLSSTVDFVTLYTSLSGEDDWVEITQIQNEGLAEPFDWNFEWEPEVEGLYDIKAEATDTLGNTELSPVVTDVTYDFTDPVSKISYPEAEAEYSANTWEEQITGTASDNVSGVERVSISIERDSDGAFWYSGDDSNPADFYSDEGEILEITDFNSDSGEWNYEFDFIEPENSPEGYTVTSHAKDKSGNEENTSQIHFYFIATDTTPPTITSAETQDTEGDGNIDAIKLTFSEAINDSQLAVGEPDGWDVADPAGDEKIDTGETENDNVLLLTFGQGPTPDTGNTPTLTYTPSGGLESTHDLAGNELVLYEGIAKDSAKPVLLSAVTVDENGNGQIDQMKLTFSENIDDSLLNTESNDGWDIDTYEGEVMSTDEITNDNILVLSFTEKAIYDTGAVPNISYTAADEIKSTHDIAGNELAATTIQSTDGAAPTTPTATPGAEDYTTDQMITLGSFDDGGTSLTSIYYTLDGTAPDNTNGTLYTTPISINADTTLKAIAYDTALNKSSIFTAEYGIAPVITEETSSLISTTTTTITWTTDDPATSRVIYDTVPHEVLGETPNYGYANSTIEADTDPKVTSHTVSLSGLIAGTIYYYRTVSHGSPETVGSEKTFSTSSETTSSGSSSSSSSGSGGTGDGKSDGLSGNTPVCSDIKPGSAPILISAIGGTNSVILIWSEASTPVSYYLITYGTGTGLQQYGNPNVGSSGTTSYTVTGLSGGSTYYFRVRAGNGCKPGDFSNELSASPGGGFVTGPASGFAEGVLGVTTEEPSQTVPITPTSTVTPTIPSQDVLGDATSIRPWWIAILFGTLLMGFVIWLKRRKPTPT